MNKGLALAKSILTWLLVAIAVIMMVFTILTVHFFDRNNRDLFGYKALIVLSDSMSTVEGDKSRGYFAAGDLVLVKEVEPSLLKAGDIIAYISTNSENYGATVTHMIRDAAVDKNGNPGFVTYGTHTGKNDENVVTYPYVVGQYQGKIPVIGRFFRFLKTTPGYLVCIFLPFLLLIVLQGVNSIQLFRKYRGEQLAEIEALREKERAEIEAERAAMAEERKRQEEMMQRLLAMQEALQGGKACAEENAKNADTEQADKKDSEL